MTTNETTTAAVQKPVGEPRYVNRCDYKKEFMMEMERVARPRAIGVVLVIVAAIDLLELILSVSKKQWTMVYCMVLCLGLILFIRFWVPKIHVKRMIGQMKTMYGTVSKVETLFYDDVVFCHNLNSDAKSQMDYDSIIRIIRTKNLYFINYKPMLYVLVDRSAFSGSEEEQEFEQFLREKAPQAKFKVRK